MSLAGLISAAARTTLYQLMDAYRLTVAQIDAASTSAAANAVTAMSARPIDTLVETMQLLPGVGYLTLHPFRGRVTAYVTFSTDEDLDAAVARLSAPAARYVEAETKTWRESSWSTDVTAVVLAGPQRPVTVQITAVP